mmetsp:Transcript_14333/g.61462  ORF Transcript_14333/g.61462 Transcript_14333/m.61462 type:complete len:742 (-) Transcript_14333:2264-4489(-)
MGARDGGGVRVGRRIEPLSVARVKKALRSVDNFLSSPLPPRSSLSSRRRRLLLGGFRGGLLFLSRREHAAADPLEVGRAPAALAPARVRLPLGRGPEQAPVHKVDVRAGPVVGQTDLRRALHHDVLLRVRERVRAEHACEPVRTVRRARQRQRAEDVARDARGHLRQHRRQPGLGARSCGGAGGGGGECQRDDDPDGFRARAGDSEPLENLRVAQRALAVRAVLGVHLPGVEQLALVALDGRQLGAVRARPRHRAVLPEPLVEHHRHLVRGRGDEHLVLPLLRERLPVALREDLLLLVQKHHVLVQERRPEHVRHPRRRRQGEQVELEPAVLPHLGTLAALAHRRDEVAAPPRFRGDAVVRRQEPRLVVSPVDLQKARRLEVVRRLGVVLADGVERRHRRIERAPEPGFSGHRPFHHAVEPGGVVVAVAHERVVRHHRVRRVDCVFEKRRPPVRHVPDLPVVPERPARSRAALAHALDFGNQQRGSHRRLQLGVFPALAPRPHQALRLHGGSCERARPRVRLDPLLLLRRAGLGHVHALSFVVETPRVVRAKQRAVILDASLGERREAVRALVLEHAPLAFAVFPHHQIDAQELRGVRLAGVQQVDHRDGVPLLGPVERARVGGLAARRRLHHRDAVGGDADERIRGGRVRRESAHRHHPRPRPDGGGGGARRDPRRGHVQLDQAVVPRRGDRPAGHQQAAPHAAPGRRSGGVEKRRRQVERVRGQVPAPPRAALRGTRRG